MGKKVGNSLYMVNPMGSENRLMLDKQQDPPSPNFTKFDGWYETITIWVAYYCIIAVLTLIMITLRFYLFLKWYFFAWIQVKI